MVTRITMLFRMLIDTRKDLCYSSYRDGQCSNPSSTPVTKSSCCCCTIVLGQPMAWGTPCQPCPMIDSPEFNSLCPNGPGMTYNGDGKYTLSSKCVNQFECNKTIINKITGVKM